MFIALRLGDIFGTIVPIFCVPVAMDSGVAVMRDIPLFVLVLFLCITQPSSLTPQWRIQDFSQGWAPSDGLVLECYLIVHFE